MKNFYKKEWWKEVIVYQIYPRSFLDTSGDGIGDLNGIIDKLGYIKSLGVDVIWLNPIYDSPCDDMGYDISDYKKIYPPFGNVADFDKLVSKAHDLGLKIMMDMVLNHTSDEHYWFEEAKKSKSNAYHDYYIWKDAGESKVLPNNWLSFFSGTAWEYNEQTGEYYLHLFSKKQPDLNWENSKVREEMKNVLRFWLDKGVDGIRFDALNFISKDLHYSDKDMSNLVNAYKNGPRLFEFLNEINRDVIHNYDIMTVSEYAGLTVEDALKISGNGIIQALYQSEGMEVDFHPDGLFVPGKFDLAKFKEIQTKWHKSLYGKAWNTVCLNNHDSPRLVSRFGNDKEYRKKSAKLFATLLLTQWGTPYLYQGDELGMTNCHFEPEEFRDVQMINYYNEQISIGKLKSEIMPGLLYRGRDNSRTPMQWSCDKNAGFSDSDKTWLKVNSNYLTINIEDSENDPDSILNYYRKMIALRKRSETLIYGDYEIVDENNSQIYAYKRFLEDESLLIILNISGKQAIFDYKKNLENSKIIISNYKDVCVMQDGKMILKPYEAIILKL
jgi:oligo-1,6-glucosidase